MRRVLFSSVHAGSVGLVTHRSVACADSDGEQRSYATLCRCLLRIAQLGGARNEIKTPWLYIGCHGLFLESLIWDCCWHFSNAAQCSDAELISSVTTACTRCVVSEREPWKFLCSTMAQQMHRLPGSLPQELYRI